MPGVVAIVIALLLIPVFVIMSGALVAALLGWSVNGEVNLNHEGSELIETNY
jgi:hypothetical protein